jgi:hypothetical protein
MSNRSKICPYCAEEILAAAVKCKHCGSALDGSAMGVTIRGADPFAEIHTPIKGKAKGKVTVLGWIGVFLGIVIAGGGCVAVLTMPAAEEEAIIAPLLLGLGMAAASFLWARR